MASCGADDPVSHGMHTGARVSLRSPGGLAAGRKFPETIPYGPSGGTRRGALQVVGGAQNGESQLMRVQYWQVRHSRDRLGHGIE